MASPFSNVRHCTTAPNIPSKRQLSDVTNVTNHNLTFAKPSTSTDSAAKSSGVKYISLKHPVATMTNAPKLVNLQKTIKKLQQKKDSYAKRLKKAWKLSKNTTFQECLQKFTTLGPLFTNKQFSEITKREMRRRFTINEEIMALRLYKQCPKAYRWLSKIFMLPSPTTLSRLISCADLRSGFNKKIFTKLKNRAQNMTKKEKLCILLFDEISITPHYDFNRKGVAITGFVNTGRQTKRNIADHVLVFMLRGVIKNYKLPLTYTFCRGTTPKEDLKLLIKNIIIELQHCGLNVLAMVCGQGKTNVSAINELIEETRVKYIRRNQQLKHQVFEINGKEIIPIFDPPHLIIGIRNHFITKDLKCIIEGEVKVAKWDHLIKLHEENPSFEGISLMPNFTEAHLDPKKIPRMKVEMATQTFSRAVGVLMGFLAENGTLPVECTDTADVLLFFDVLFDSMNGSYGNLKNRMEKLHLRPVKPISRHSQVWAKAKIVLNSMKFVTKEGREGSVPSVTNWLHTLDSIEVLKDRLLKKHKVRFFWMGHFNQDPLRNFFESIRSHGYRNIPPTPSSFESAFVRLLINKL